MNKEDNPVAFAEANRAKFRYCPECHGLLIQRRNSTTGARFLGCVNYPDCDYTYPPAPRMTGRRNWSSYGPDFDSYGDDWGTFTDLWPEAAGWGVD